MTKREATVERYLVRKVSEAGGMAIKLNPFNMAGLPDRLILLPGARIIFAELKRPGEKPRKIQEAFHNRLRKLGFQVEIVTCNEQIRFMLKAVMA